MCCYKSLINIFQEVLYTQRVPSLVRASASSVFSILEAMYSFGGHGEQEERGMCCNDTSSVFPFFNVQLITFSVTVMHESDCEWCWLHAVRKMELDFSSLTFQHLFLVQSKIIFLPFPVSFQSILRILAAFLFHCALLSIRLQNPAGTCTEILVENCPGFFLLTVYKANQSMFQDTDVNKK